MGKGKGFGGGMMGGGMKNQMQMMRQAQKMQADMLKMQEELEAAEYEAAVGGGVVKAVVSGKKELLRLNIEPDAVDPEDVDMLQDLVVAAVNEALREAENAHSDSMGQITGGLGLDLGGLF